MEPSKPINWEGRISELIIGYNVPSKLRSGPGGVPDLGQDTTNALDTTVNSGEHPS